MYKKQLMFFTSLLVLFSAFFFGCNQDKFDAGIELVPDSLRLKSEVHDISAVGYTYKTAPILTSGSSKVLLGNYYDPIFGYVKASFVTQMLISTNTEENDSFVNENVVLDSLVLYLRYPTSGLQTYGNSHEDCTIDITRINTFLDYSKDYYDTLDVNTLNIDLTPITSPTFNPYRIIDDAENEADDIYNQAILDELDSNPDNPDTASIKRPTPLAVVSVKLPGSFMNEVYNELKQSIIGTTTFVEKIKGFHITPNPTSNNNSISVFDYNNSETKVVLYYKTSKDTLEYNFGLNSAAVHFNLYEHDFSTGNNVLTNIYAPESKEDSVVYIQGIGGLGTKIMFPNIEELISQGLWAVNRAELILQVESGIDTVSYPTPEKLILKRINEDGEEHFLQEYLSYNQNTGITSYNGAENSNGVYKFDITYYMQKVFKKDYINNGLILSIPDESVNPSRVVLTNRYHSNRMKLILTSTKLSN